MSRLFTYVCASAAVLVASTLTGSGLTGSGLTAGSAARIAPDAVPDAPAPAAAVAFAEPGLSPDGREIAFVSGGDIWTVPVTGGEARLLVSHPANESRPLYSPDGRALAFVSTRTGQPDIYVLSLADGALRRLTWDDAGEGLSGWSKDSRWVIFSSSSRDISGMNDVYKIAADGGTPMPITADGYVSEFFGTPSPDGKLLAFSARGVGSGQWWRHGHSHIDESEIWTVSLDAAPGAQVYSQITLRQGKALWPMWSGDGASIFFVSDRDGQENIWRTPLLPADRALNRRAQPKDGATPKDEATRVTSFKDGRVLWPSASADGRTLVFERDFQIWTLDTASGRAQALSIARKGAPAGPVTEAVRQTSQFEELALSPDGKKVAFIARGDVFAASAKDGGDAARVTSSDSIEADLSWAPDSHRLVYSAQHAGGRDLRVYDLVARKETTLTSKARDYMPLFSPDGAALAFLRDEKQVCIYTFSTKAESCVVSDAHVATTIDGGNTIAWSPDGKWLAYFADGAKGFSNVHIVPAAGGASKPVSFVANAFGGSLTWAPDGTYLMFSTNQRTEIGQAARVDLVLRTPKFREDQFRDLFPSTPSMPEKPAPSSPATSPDPQEKKEPEKKDEKKEADAGDADKKDATARKAPAKPVDIVFDDIRRRLSFLPVGVDVGSLTISPDGKSLLLSASSEGQQNLYLYSLDELARERPVARQLTSTNGSKGSAQFSPDSKQVFYLEGGRVQVLTVESRDSKPVSITAEMEVDFTRDRRVVFQQAWSLLNENFYDAAYHGADWAGARGRFAPYAEGAATSDELRRVISLMIGELNASHLGIGGPPGDGGPTTGRLGLRFDAAEYWKSGRLKVTDVIPLGPAAVSRAIAVGDVLAAVEGTPITARTNLDRLLDRTLEKRVTLTIERANGERKDVAVRPVGLNTEKNLRYRQWVEAKRAYVAKKSNGRLGYVHMPDMGQGSLTQLYADLDVENQTRDGVVIDIRNNNGGFVNAYALDVFSRRPYLQMTQRNRQPTPARPTLGQRALELPTVLVINQHSLSDAEDFTEGYRALKLGSVVGEPTAGWIIYTWGTRLIDGSSFRLPRTRVVGVDGKTMELNPRPVDIPVTREVGEEARGERDSQLDAAIAELTGQIDGGKTDRRPAPTTSGAGRSGQDPVRK